MKLISKYLVGILELSGIIYNLFFIWALTCVVCAYNFRASSLCPSVFITWGDSLTWYFDLDNIPFSIWPFLIFGALGSGIGFYRLYKNLFIELQTRIFAISK